MSLPGTNLEQLQAEAKSAFSRLISNMTTMQKKDLILVAQYIDRLEQDVTKGKIVLPPWSGN